MALGNLFLNGNVNNQILATNSNGSRLLVHIQSNVNNQILDTSKNTRVNLKKLINQNLAYSTYVVLWAQLCLSKGQHQEKHGSLSSSILELTSET